MIYVIFIILGLFLIFRYLWYSAQKEIEEEDKQPYDCVDKNEVMELLNEVKSIESFKKLQTKYNRIDSSITGESSKSKLISFETISEAYYKACNKVFVYQFDPILDLDSPREEIENFRKFFSIDEYNKFKNEIGNDKDFVEITYEDYFDNNYEKKPTYIDKLLIYKDVMQDKSLSLDDKAVKILDLCKNKAFKEEFFFGLTSKEIHEEVLMSELTSMKVPLPKKLYAAGIKSVKDLQNCDLKEIKKIPGFGPKKVELLKQIIETTHNSK